MYTYEIHVDTGGQPGEDWIPHTFITVTDENGEKFTRGFGPAETGLFGEGRVFDDEGHEESIRSGKIDISKQQYDKLKNGMDASEVNPPDYKAIGVRSCLLTFMGQKTRPDPIHTKT